MSAAAQKSGVPVLVGHHRRHNPIIQKTRKVVSSGELGVITAISGRWLAAKAASYYDVEWRRHRSSGGPALINMIHDIDSLRVTSSAKSMVFKLYPRQLAGVSRWKTRLPSSSVSQTVL